MKGTKTLLSYILFIVGIQYKVICRLPRPICEEDHFTCKNRECVPNFWVCDDADDCGDNSDETDCPSSDSSERCDADEFKCGNGKCVMIEFVCDTEDDCGDNTDESNCTVIHRARQCDQATNFRCKNEKCVPRALTCNNIDDCGDNSDESTESGPYCSPVIGCTDGFFHCNKSRKCIHELLVCDGTPDCGGDDASDEAICDNRTCESDDFKCDNGRCISKLWHCDRQNDCGDSSDERNCSVGCGESQFQCVKSGHCIEGNFKCDEFYDCMDGSDERGCSYPNSTTPSPSTTSKSGKPRTTAKPSTTTRTSTSACRTNQYKCKNQERCLQRSWVCDGEADCDGMDDESPEVCSTHTCQADHFQCKNKKCVDKDNRCDGHDHCGDGSDEVNCTEARVSCTSDSYMCSASVKCIRKTAVCDGRSDCPLHDDESPLCGNNECLKNNGNCSSICRDLPIGFKCECPSGYEEAPISKKCVDINECHIFGSCSQACVNYKGTYACECDKDYTVDPSNNRSCLAEGPAPLLVYTNRFDVRTVSTNGRESKLVVDGARSASALAVSYAEKMLYWADKGLKTISRKLLNGSGKTEVLLRDIQKPEGLAVDYLGKKLYWTNSYLNQIGVANLDGSHSKVLYQGGFHEDIRSLAVYPEKGYVFWTNWAGHSKIERANLDGSNKSTLYSSGLIWPTGLAIDKTNDRLYWTEFSAICTIEINGNGYKKILNELSRPYGLTVFEDLVYWTDFVDRTIYKANKFNGENKQTVRGSYTAPLDLEIIHPLVQSFVYHPCKRDNGGCSHLCFMTPARTSVCACPGVMELQPNKKRCKHPVVTTTLTSKATPSTSRPPPTTRAPSTTRTSTMKVTTTTRSTTKSVPTTPKYVSTSTTRPSSTTPRSIKLSKTTLPTISTGSSSSAVPPTSNVEVVVKDSVVANDGTPATRKVYIGVGIFCLMGTLIFIAFGVYFLRKKRRGFQLSMVYETQTDDVKTKNFENKIFQSKISLDSEYDSSTLGSKMSEYDRNDGDETLDNDRAPILENMI